MYGKDKEIIADRRIHAGSLTMNSKIKSYVSRYIVPFYFNYENNGYAEILEYFRKCENLNTAALGVPKDCCWVEVGFWENYKSESIKQSEMDLYTYLLQIFEESPEIDERYETNIGVSFVLKTNGSIFNLQYKSELEELVSFRCNDLGLLFFRNGIGFVWYDIEFSKNPSIQTYVKFQQDFKELARTHNDNFVKKKGKDLYESFQMGKWLLDIVNAKRFGIRFWSEREVLVENTMSQKYIPDKALLFQYLFVDETEDTYRYDLAFRIANGYDEKYNSPKTLMNDLYEPFGNTCFYTSKAGMAYVVSNNGTNEEFFMNNFKDKFIRDYFFIYILLLYQTYSCAHYSRLLTKLPADVGLFEKKAKYVHDLESLNNQINLFLVKSVYESVSNIQHQNGLYKYAKKALSLEEDINSLTIGLGALKEIEKEKLRTLAEEEEKLRQEKFESKDRALNEGLVVFGFLVVISAALDAVSLVDWFSDNISRINSGHIMSLGVIGLLTLFMFVVLIVNTRKK